MRIACWVSNRGVGYKNTLFCNTTSNKCQHYPRIGEPCNESIHAILSVHCAEGFCDEQTNVCKEFPQKGEECKYYNNIYNARTDFIVAITFAMKSQTWETYATKVPFLTFRAKKAIATKRPTHAYLSHT